MAVRVFRMPLPFFHSGRNGRHDLSGLSGPPLTQSQMKHAYILLNSQACGTTRILRSWGSKSSSYALHAYAPARVPLSHWFSHIKLLEKAQQQSAILIVSPIQWDSWPWLTELMKGGDACHRWVNGVLNWGVGESQRLYICMCLWERGLCPALLLHTPTSSPSRTPGTTGKWEDKSREDLNLISKTLKT